MKFDILHLNLLSSLYYIPRGNSPAETLDPFDSHDIITRRGRETLFCFELDETECESFNPGKEKLFGHLVFCGEAAGEPAEKEPAALLELPQGKYLFSQKRELLNREQIVSMAVEIQQEGLWQRLKPGRRLYLRYLFEDGKWVTQLFRPVSA